MQIWFCQTCGEQVTKADLGDLPGLTAKTIVYCKDCQRKERRADRIAEEAKPKSRRRTTTTSPRPARRSSGALRTRVTEEVREAEVAEEDSTPSRSRMSPQKSSGMGVMVAGGFGVALLIAGIVFFLLTDNSPPPAQRPEPPKTEKIPEDAKQPAVPLKPEVTIKPADAAKVLETKAEASFVQLEKKLNDSSLTTTQKVEAIDAFLTDYGDAIVGARARTARLKLVTPEPAPEIIKTADTQADRMKFLRAAMLPDPVNKHTNKSADYLAKLDYANALTELDLALKLDPDNSAILRGRADIHRNLYQYPESLADAVKSRTIDPSDWRSYLLEAVASYAMSNEEQYNAARKNALEKAKAAQYPVQDVIDFVDLEAPHARVFYQALPLEKSIPVTAQQWMVRGEARIMLGKLDQGESDFNEAARLDPANCADAFLGLLSIADAREDWKGRMEICKKWAKAVPDSAFSLNALGYELLNSKVVDARDAGLALTTMSKASDLSAHKNAAIEDTWAQALFQNNQIKKAIEIQKRAISLLANDIKPEQREIYTQHLAQYEFAAPPEP